jgi:hypothetical protein
LVNLAELLLDFTVAALFFIENIQGGVCIDLHEPTLVILINKHIEAQNLKTARILVILRYKRVVGALEVGLKCDHCLDGHLIYLEFY